MNDIVKRLKRLATCPYRSSKEQRSSGYQQVSLALARQNSQKRGELMNSFDWMLPGRPSHVAMKRKVMQYKQISKWGKFWDIMQIFLSVLTCCLYIAETYTPGYNEHQLYKWNEIVVTQFFLLDFIFNWFTAINTKIFFQNIMTIVDVLTIVPVYISFSTGSAVNLSIFRFIRILRLVRVLRTFRLLGDLSGLKRQLITLSLTLLSLSFMAAGIVNVMENDVQQLTYDCQYINAYTNYRPSCDRWTDTYDSESCDCKENNCMAVYNRHDDRYEPTGITCVKLPFFDCFYFIVVTISTVGYGDIAASTTPSRAVILLFILTSAVVIPMQLKQLTNLLSAHSVFRRAYISDGTEEHVVLCGHVNNRQKLERFLKEFFHPDRMLPSSPHFHIVVLCPEDPTEEVRSLLVSPRFDSRVTYLIGSALSVEDLQRCRVDIASAVFFLSKIEAKEEEALAEGTTTVLRTLAVTDFNPDIQCLVEVLHTHDSDILKNSDVEVVLCVDEFKTVLLARNSGCPGISTLINNLFRTYGGPCKANSEHWMTEYHYGQCMETYYVPLTKMFMEAFKFEWNIAAESVYLEYGCMLIGVFESSTGAIHLNPMQLNFKANMVDVMYFAIVIAPDQHTASSIAKGIGEYSTIARLTNGVIDAEYRFGVRALPKQEGTMQRAQSSRRNFDPHTKEDRPQMQDMTLFCKLLRRQRQGQLMTGGYVKGAVNSSGRSTNSSETSSSERNSVLKPSNMVQPRNSLLRGSKVEYSAEDLGQITHAHHLTQHIIVLGCKDNVATFVAYADLDIVTSMNEMRRPILYVGSELPRRWMALRKKHPELYFLEGDISLKTTFSRMNISKAYSVIMLAHRREELEFEEDENLDFEMLFLYLKISSFIPSTVNFTIELTSGRNMSVLNTVAVKKERREQLMEAMHGDLDEPSVSLQDKMMVDAIADVTGEREMLLDQLRGMYHSSKGSKTDPKMKRGVFFSQYVQHLERQPSFQGNSSRLLKQLPGRRLSSIQLRNYFGAETHTGNAKAWDGLDNHNNLAIYAAGRAFVPDVVDNILCQSFFSSLTSNLCESLVCGKDGQAMFLMSLPRTFTYRYFSDVYRACIARNVQVIGLYRAPSSTERSFMPFVYTCPPPKTILNVADKLFVFATTADIKNVEEQLALPFGKRGNTVILGVNEITTMRRRSVASASISRNSALAVAKGHVNK
mmetsp:Transcript_19518/g.28071  ORF Transcript_19518/g.28071 Transcript_19518/m.28071 type:complete len:1196 (+) Transcript_19518:99-3686(+)